MRIRFTPLIILISLCLLGACKSPFETPQDAIGKTIATADALEHSAGKVTLAHGTDESAGGLNAFIVKTNNATYYLEKSGGGLSSMLDKDGIDWLGFSNEVGSGWKGEFRGFPNAVHQQDGNYFHAMNAKTDPSSAQVSIESEHHVQIIVTTENKKWQGIYDFYPDRLDFTMSRVSSGYHYWIQYEGVPGGDNMDPSDFWYSSIDDKKRLINEHYNADLPGPEWVAFGDEKFPRMIYLVHHNDDELLDTYESRPYMTVFAFGRNKKDKFLNTPATFSIGFVESVEYEQVVSQVNKVLGSANQLN